MLLWPVGLNVSLFPKGTTRPHRFFFFGFCQPLILSASWSTNPKKGSLIITDYGQNFFVMALNFMNPTRCEKIPSSAVILYAVETKVYWSPTPLPVYKWSPTLLLWQTMCSSHTLQSFKGCSSSLVWYNTKQLIGEEDSYPDDNWKL